MATPPANPNPSGGTNPTPTSTPAANNSTSNQQNQQNQTQNTQQQTPTQDFTPNNNTGLEVREVNPPLTPDQVIGVVDTPVPTPVLPTLKLENVKIPTVKNKTIQGHLKAIEGKMIATEKLMKNIVKLQRLQYTTEKQLFERKRELYQNTFEEYLLDKTIDFGKKKKDCTCISIPENVPKQSSPPLIPPLGNPATAPATQPATSPATQPATSPVRQPGTVLPPIFQPGGSPAPAPFPNPGPGPGGLTLPPPTPSPVPDVNIPNWPGPNDNTPLPQLPPTTTDRGRDKGRAPGQTPGFDLKGAIDGLINAGLITATAAAILFPGDGPLLDAVGLAALISRGVMARATISAVVRKVLTKKAAEQLMKQVDKLVGAPRPRTSFAPSYASGGIVPYASGGIPGGEDLELYDSKSQDYFRGLSSQALQVASDIPVGPHTPLPHPGYVRPQGGHIPRPNLRGMPGPMGNPMPWGWQPTLLAKGGIVKSYGGGGWLQQLGKFLPGTGTVMAPKGVSLGYQDKFLGIPIGARREIPLNKTYAPAQAARYNASPSAPSTLTTFSNGPLQGRHVSIPKTTVSPAATSSTSRTEPLTSRTQGLASSLSQQSEQKQAQINELLGKNDKTMTWGQANQELGNRLGWSTRGEQMMKAKQQGMFADGGITGGRLGFTTRFGGQVNNMAGITAGLDFTSGKTRASADAMIGAGNTIVGTSPERAVDDSLYADQSNTGDWKGVPYALPAFKSEVRQGLMGAFGAGLTSSFGDSPENDDDPESPDQRNPRRKTPTPERDPKSTRAMVRGKPPIVREKPPERKKPEGIVLKKDGKEKPDDRTINRNSIVPITKLAKSPKEESRDDDANTIIKKSKQDFEKFGEDFNVSPPDESSSGIKNLESQQNQLQQSSSAPTVDTMSTPPVVQSLGNNTSSPSIDAELEPPSSASMPQEFIVPSSGPL